MTLAPDPILDPDAVLDRLAKSWQSPEAAPVLQSWLDAGLGSEPVRSFVIGWLHRYSRVEKGAGFVLRAWLKAGGDLPPVRPYLLRWLYAHGEDRQASFVLAAWMRAGGSLKSVQGYVERWLALHVQQEEAMLVLRSWIWSEGSLVPIHEPLLGWLRAHPGTESLVLIRLLASRGGLPFELLGHLLQWCRNEPQHALRILVSLGLHLLHPRLKTEVLAAFDAAARPLLDLPKLMVWQRTSLATLFEILGESPDLRARTADAFLLWIHHSGAFGEAMARAQLVRHSTNRPGTLRYVADLARRRQLDPERDRKPLLHCFRWVNTWVVNQPQQAREFLAELLWSGLVPQKLLDRPDVIAIHQ